MVAHHPGYICTAPPYQPNEPPRETSFCFPGFLDNGSPTHLQLFILTACSQQTLARSSQSNASWGDCTTSCFTNGGTQGQSSQTAQGGCGVSSRGTLVPCLLLLLWRM